MKFCEQRIPFEMKVDPFYSEENVASIKLAYERIESGQGVSFDVKEE